MNLVELELRHKDTCFFAVGSSCGRIDHRFFVKMTE